MYLLPEVHIKALMARVPGFQVFDEGLETGCGMEIRFCGDRSATHGMLATVR